MSRKNRVNITREYDNIYYNITINSNNSNRFSVPKLSISRTVNILDKASDYYVSVIRFNIPSEYVPILIFVPEAGQINVGIYNITLSYQTFDVTENLEYINRGNGSFTSMRNGYYYMYDFQQMVDMINVALENAMTILKTNFPADVPLQASPNPFMIYDPISKLFAFYVDELLFNTVNDPHIEMYMNDPLWTLFGSFPFQRIYNGQPLNPVDSKDVQILFKNHGNNLVPNPNSDPNDETIYIYLSQEYVTTYNWNPFKKIVITTTSLPILGENIDSTGNNQRTILTDFIPSVSATEFRTVYQYYPISQYRLIDLTNDAPLKAFDINVWWEDVDGDLQLIYLPWNSQISIKIAFLKKNLYKYSNKVDVVDRIDNKEVFGNQKPYLNQVKWA